MNAKELGFKFQPGDTVRVLGRKEVMTVVACNLSLGGVGQEVRRTYEIVSAYIDAAPVVATEAVLSSSE